MVLKSELLTFNQMFKVGSSTIEQTYTFEKVGEALGDAIETNMAQKGIRFKEDILEGYKQAAYKKDFHEVRESMEASFNAFTDCSLYHSSRSYIGCEESEEYRTWESNIKNHLSNTKPCTQMAERMYYHYLLINDSFNAQNIKMDSFYKIFKLLTGYDTLEAFAEDFLS